MIYAISDVIEAGSIPTKSAKLLKEKHEELVANSKQHNKPRHFIVTVKYVDKDGEDTQVIGLQNNEQHIFADTLEEIEDWIEPVLAPFKSSYANMGIEMTYSIDELVLDE